MGRKLMSKEFRRGHDLHIVLNEKERDEADFEFKRLGVGPSTWVRTMIRLCRRGEIVVPPSAFDGR